MIMTASRALARTPTRLSTRAIPGAETRKFANLELRGLSRDGTFSGYASVFGEVDLGKDAIERGAFLRSLKTRGAGGVRMLFQHDPAEPIGAWKTIREDSRGLYVEGVLADGVSRAREVHQLLKNGALDGLSIGFRTVRAKTDAKSGVRRILEADLWEISVVTFPMLPSARVQNIKNARWFRDKETELVRAMRRAARMMLQDTFK
ncbi:HK97 family phage prohead protease [Rhizobium sp. S163]|uniref:HK97 family phage prohead protease n=1 Tax=Rhizobium sp. S163 TaxID=3055039 RepID=UPI0025A9E544|nr:HK97 family phage prohead protease [Rhizobium sp. S163]MDM9647980.1 HK97 family phage prohead protease [Rhizobium sp. S163]